MTFNKENSVIHSANSENFRPKYSKKTSQKAQK